MSPYFVLVLMMSVIWLLLFVIRKQHRRRIVVMSVVVIPFAFFDYFSQPVYWHPETYSSIPVGIEGVLFGFSFGGVAAGIQVDKVARTLVFKRQVVDARKLMALSPVLIISLGLWQLSGVNLMITLPVGLFIGILIIVRARPDLMLRLVSSSVLFGIIYALVILTWLLIFPNAQQWWNLKIYAGITVMNVPLGELLFGFLFGGFWNASYDFVFASKLASPDTGYATLAG